MSAQWRCDRDVIKNDEYNQQWLVKTIACMKLLMMMYDEDNIDLQHNHLFKYDNEW